LVLLLLDKEPVTFGLKQGQNVGSGHLKAPQQFAS